MHGVERRGVDNERRYLRHSALIQRIDLTALAILSSNQEFSHLDLALAAERPVVPSWRISGPEILVQVTVDHITNSIGTQVAVPTVQPDPGAGRQLGIDVLDQGLEINALTLGRLGPSAGRTCSAPIPRLPT